MHSVNAMLTTLAQTMCDASAGDAMSPDDLYRLAADFVAEHGQVAVDYAHQAAVQIGSDGDAGRAEFWLLLSVVLDDIVMQRLDPDCSITIH